MKFWFKRQPVITVDFYISAILMLLLAFLNLYNVHSYIRQLVSAKQLIISKQFMKVMITYLEAVVPYVFYGFVLAGIGYMIMLLMNRNSDIKEEMKVYKAEDIQESDEELDDFLNTITLK